MPDYNPFHSILDDLISVQPMNGPAPGIFYADLIGPGRRQRGRVPRKLKKQRRKEAEAFTSRVGDFGKWMFPIIKPPPAMLLKDMPNEDSEYEKIREEKSAC